MWRRLLEYIFIYSKKVRLRAKKLGPTCGHKSNIQNKKGIKLGHNCVKYI